MSIIPILRAKEIIALLLKLGFKIVFQKGSHVKPRHIFDATRIAIVPMHNKPLPRGFLLYILKQARVSIKEFLQILGK